MVIAVKSIVCLLSLESDFCFSYVDFKLSKANSSPSALERIFSNKLSEALKLEDLEALKTAHEELSKASHSLADKMYKEASEASNEAPDDANEANKEGEKAKDDKDVIDAEFTDK